MLFIFIAAIIIGLWITKILLEDEYYFLGYSTFVAVIAFVVYMAAISPKGA